MKIITCPNCNKHVPLISLQSNEISGFVTMDDAENMGFNVIDTSVIIAQAKMNRGECKCGDENQKEKVIDPSEQSLF